MKWVKVAIGAVIAIMSIGIIATSVYDMTQETVKDEVVTFEVLTETTVTSGTFDKISQYAITDNNVIINIKTYKLNNIDSDGTSSLLVPDTYVNLFTTFDVLFVDLEIEADDTISDIESSLQNGDIFEITFEVTQAPILSGVTATLLLLAPLIFAGGVLAYLLNKQEL